VAGELCQERQRGDDLETPLGPPPASSSRCGSGKARQASFFAVQKTKRTCLAFKILAAGRLSDRKPWVEKAFRQTFESIKPGDGAIIGIYDRDDDQPGQDAGYTKRFGTANS
jgi:hypothetical protein